MGFTARSISDIEMRSFHKIDKEWALLTAGSAGGFNAMTVSWGQLGTLWNRPAATVFVRPQRYTREFLEREEGYSLSFFDGGFMKELGYLGSVSGRDEAKLAKSGLSAVFAADGTPYIEQARLALICKKLYSDDIRPDNFIATGIIPELYPLKDFHRFYIGEVVEALEKI
jgi:flavin reductase (DIM6/NTAB) family NADH-FMN oxidoreductase RutF